MIVLSKQETQTIINDYTEEEAQFIRYKKCIQRFALAILIKNRESNDAYLGRFLRLEYPVSNDNFPDEPILILKSDKGYIVTTAHYNRIVFDSSCKGEMICSLEGAKVYFRAEMQDRFLSEEAKSNGFILHSQVECDFKSKVNTIVESSFDKHLGVNYSSNITPESISLLKQDSSTTDASTVSKLLDKSLSTAISDTFNYYTKHNVSLKDDRLFKIESYKESCIKSISSLILKRIGEPTCFLYEHITIIDLYWKKPSQVIKLFKEELIRGISSLIAEIYPIDMLISALNSSENISNAYDSLKDIINDMHTILGHIQSDRVNTCIKEPIDKIIYTKKLIISYKALSIKVNDELGSLKIEYPLLIESKSRKDITIFDPLINKSLVVAHRGKSEDYISEKLKVSIDSLKESISDIAN